MKVVPEKQNFEEFYKTEPHQQIVQGIQKIYSNLMEKVDQCLEKGGNIAIRDYCKFFIFFIFYFLLVLGKMYNF